MPPVFYAQAVEALNNHDRSKYDLIDWEGYHASGKEAVHI